MTDLSKLLDDVYGDLGPSVEVKPPSAPAAEDPPDWSITSVLDEVFADWVPGGAPLAVDELDEQTDQHAIGLMRSPELDEVTPGAPIAWTRTDDDILPGRRSRGRGRGRTKARTDD